MTFKVSLRCGVLKELVALLLLAAGLALCHISCC